MDKKFTVGLRFIVISDPESTDGWFDELARWKGKILTVKSILDDGDACLVNENDEEWILGDVDWPRTENHRYYWWRIDTERSDYRSIVCYYSYNEVNSLTKAFGNWFKFKLI